MLENNDKFGNYVSPEGIIHPASGWHTLFRIDSEIVGIGTDYFSLFSKHLFTESDAVKTFCFIQFLTQHHPSKISNMFLKAQPKEGGEVYLIQIIFTIVSPENPFWEATLDTFQTSFTQQPIFMQ